MLTQEDDQQLVERVQRGDKRAFDLLVLKYQHKILGLIVRFVHDTHEAQDVAQEAFVKAYRALGNFRGDSAFYTWLYRIAINTAKNYLVSRGRRPPDSDVSSDDAEFYDGDHALKDIESPERALLRDEIEATVHRTIAQLPDDLRTGRPLGHGLRHQQRDERAGEADHEREDREAAHVVRIDAERLLRARECRIEVVLGRLDRRAGSQGSEVLVGLDAERPRGGFFCHLETRHQRQKFLASVAVPVGRARRAPATSR